MLERFMQHVDFDEKGCWLWTGALFNQQYGKFVLRRGKLVAAHRWLYRELVGPIPDSMPILRHTCFVKRCVNPDHLVPSTYSDNILDGDVARTGTRTHFVCGHPRVAENQTKRNECKQCRDIKNAEYRRRKQTLAAGGSA